MAACRTSLIESKRAEKIALRLWTLGLWKQKTVLDLYAGEGNLSRLYAPNCEQLICVEKDPVSFERLRENLQGTNTQLHNTDNMEFLEKVAEIPKITFVDFDAYGCPNRQIQRFFERYPVTHAIMVNVTDGTLLHLRTPGSMDLAKHFLVNLYPKGGLDFYAKARLRYLLPWLQETFIHLLAAKHGLSTCLLYHAMNMEANSTYYGFILYPDHAVSLKNISWGIGGTPSIVFKTHEKSWIKSLKKTRKNA